MPDVYAYRASDELAAALRDYAERDAAFRAEVIEFDDANPGHEVMWARSPFSADYHAMGFHDGADEVPAGLSRAKSRISLRPKRGQAGQPWREALARMEKRPRIERVWREFEVESAGRGPGTGTGGYYLAPTQYLDAGWDGVLVACKYDIGVDHNGDPKPSPHLTPIPLSEFYAIKERVDAEREAVASVADDETPGGDA